MDARFVATSVYTRLQSHSWFSRFSSEIQVTRSQILQTFTPHKYRLLSNFLKNSPTVYCSISFNCWKQVFRRFSFFDQITYFFSKLFVDSDIATANNQWSPQGYFIPGYKPSNITLFRNKQIFNTWKYWNLRIKMPSSKTRVAIVGGGVAGLVVARHIASRPENYNLTLFEQTEQVGGTWVYTDDTEFDKNGLFVHSSMYKNLRYEFIYKFSDREFNKCWVSKTIEGTRNSSPKQVLAASVWMIIFLQCATVSKWERCISNNQSSWTYVIKTLLPLKNNSPIISRTQTCQSQPNVLACVKINSSTTGLSLKFHRLVEDFLWILRQI